MNDLISAAYSERLRRVCDHIERHLDEPLSLEVLSRMAHSSPFHFHRQFTVWSGLPLYRYIQWLRLRRRHGGWRLIRKIKLSISRWMPDFRIRSRSHVLSKPRLVKARAGFGNRRTGWPGTNAFLNLRYRSSMSWT